MRMVSFIYQWVGDRTCLTSKTAENYYTADYPDEDLDWDDQFDRNPYRYAHENGSDKGGDDDDELDDDDDDAWDKIGDAKEFTF